MKHAIICHGYNLHSPNWLEIIWGLPDKDKLGRVPKAVLEVVQQNASLLIFGTGASEKNGIMEADYIYNYLLTNFNNLKKFSAFSSINLEVLKARIKGIAKTETKSKNTFEEADFALAMCRDEGVKLVTIVSNPSHIPRCARDSKKINDLKDYNLTSIYTVPCDTDFVGEVVIFEPQSGPNQKYHLAANQVFADFFKIPAHLRLGVLEKINKIFIMKSKPR